MEIVVFTLGGMFYGLTEILYRGYTHWTMLLTGGAIVLTFYILAPFLFGMNVFMASAIGALIVTLYEFIVGVIVNLWLHWEVWDYSAKAGNVLGQICPQFTLYWFVICLAFFTLIKYNRLMF